MDFLSIPVVTAPRKPHLMQVNPGKLLRVRRRFRNKYHEKIYFSCIKKVTHIIIQRKWKKKQKNL